MLVHGDWSRFNSDHLPKRPGLANTSVMAWVLLWQKTPELGAECAALHAQAEIKELWDRHICSMFNNISK